MRSIFFLMSVALFAAEAEKCVFLPSLPSSHFSPQFSFLYWGCAEKGLDFAVSTNSSSPVTEMRVHQPNFEWSPAFRLLLGFGLPIDGWSIDCSYSFFSKNKKERVNQQSMSVWTSPSAFQGNNLFVRWQKASSKWKIFANFFDLFLSDEFCNGAVLSFQPAFGLRSSLFYQDYDLSYKNGTQSSVVKMKNDSFHLGPSFSFVTNWAFTSSWSLVGSLTGAVLASNFDVSREETDVMPLSEETYRFKEKFLACRPQAGGRLGFSWKVLDKKTSYELAASYEAQIWWKQNMFLRHIDSVNFQGQNLAPVQGDLFFQGLTVDLRLNY